MFKLRKSWNIDDAKNHSVIRNSLITTFTSKALASRLEELEVFQIASLLKSMRLRKTLDN